jgi:hypothetical protein
LLRISRTILSPQWRLGVLQGDRHRKEVYRRLGTLEVQDILQVVRSGSSMLLAISCLCLLSPRVF